MTGDEIIPPWAFRQEVLRGARELLHLPSPTDTDALWLSVDFTWFFASQVRVL